MEIDIVANAANLTIYVTADEAAKLFNALDMSHDVWDSEQLEMIERIRETLDEHFEFEDEVGEED